MIDRNVAIVGGFRASDDQEVLAFALGYEVILRGYNLVCGGREGVMREAARGGRTARTAGGQGVVVGILPGADTSEANPFLDVCIPTGMGYLRNGLVVVAAGAVVVVGGRSGTLSELALAWQMSKPICFLGPGEWERIWADRPLDDRRQESLPAFHDVEGVVTWLETVLPLKGSWQ